MKPKEMSAEEVEATIAEQRARSLRRAQFLDGEERADCLCGHPYHSSGCPAIVAGYEFNESCRCDEYEPDE